MIAQQARPDIRTQQLIFSSIALVLVIAWLMLLHGAFFETHRALATFGVAIDLAIVLPLIWYFLAVRPGRATTASLVPIVILGFVAANLLTPGNPPLAMLVLTGCAELTLIGFGVIRISQAIRRTDGSADPLERIDDFAAQVIPFAPAARMLACELGLVWHALFSWKHEPVRSSNRSSWANIENWNGLIIGLNVVIVFETIGMHLWLMDSWPRAVWLLTLSDLYAIVWLLGDARALTLSSLRLRGDAIDLAFGMRWKARIPLESIASIETITGAEDDLWNVPWDLKLALVEAPDTLITLREPMEIQGIYGLRKTVQKIGLRIEDRSLLHQIELEP